MSFLQTYKMLRYERVSISSEVGFRFHQILNELKKLPSQSVIHEPVILHLWKYSSIIDTINDTVVSLLVKLI